MPEGYVARGTNEGHWLRPGDAADLCRRGYNPGIEPLTTDRVALAASVADDPRCRDRVSALLGRITAGRVDTIPDAALPGILAELGERKQLLRGGLARRGRHKDLVVLGRFAGQIIPGYSWRELRDGRYEARTWGVLCQSAVEIQSAVGCPFDCTYCPYSPFLCLHVDVDEFVTRVERLARDDPRQLLFKLNNRSDTLGLEPEYGLAPALVERFAKIDGKYLLLYSKGHEIEPLLHLDHGGKTVASFTLTPEPIAELVEPGASTPEQRLTAIARLARKGYPIRVRLSPIVPIRGWQNAYAHLLERLAAAATVEVATLWVLSMIDLDELDRIVPLARLDDTALAEARAAATRMRGQKGAPFPPETRASLYRQIAAMAHEMSPQTRMALCLEKPEVWEAAGPLLVPHRGSSFVCNCGPRATPEAVASCRPAPEFAA